MAHAQVGARKAARLEEAARRLKEERRLHVRASLDTDRKMHLYRLALDRDPSRAAREQEGRVGGMEEWAGRESSATSSLSDLTANTSQGDSKLACCPAHCTPLFSFYA